MKTSRVVKIMERDRVITGLAHVRKEWEQATDDCNLVACLGSIGLVLADIADAIGLTPEEQVKALGSKLSRAVREA